MPSTYSSSLRLTLQATGENAGTWGNITNTGVIQLIDTSIAGTAAITMTGADYTLTNNNGGVDEARAMILDLGGSPGGSYNVVCPSVSKLYVVVNGTGHTQTLKTSAGTGISIPNGKTAFLRCDGTNVVNAISTFSELQVVTQYGTTFSGHAQTTPVVVAFNPTAMTVDCTLSNVFTTTMTANVTTAPTISNPKDGQTINWFLTQDATGSRTMTWPASFKWPTGFVTTLSTAANSVDLVTATYRSTTGHWYVTILKAFT